jgi:hypothetical protein
MWWLLFLVLAAMTTLWSLSIPLMGSPDEPAHTVKAVAVGRGEFQTGFVRKRGGGFVIVSIPQTSVRVPRAYRGLARLTACWSGHLDVPVSCGPTVGSDEVEVTTSTYVGTYPPLYYVLVGWLARVFAPGRALYAMRILTGLVCAALLASGLVAASRLGRMLLVGAVLGITPMALFMAGSINPSGIEIAAAFCLWPSLLALLTWPGRVPTRWLVHATAASVLLGGMRPLSPVFVVAIAVVVSLLVGSRATFRRLWADARFRVAGTTVAAFTALSALYVLVNHSLGALIEFGGPSTPSRVELARRAFDLTGTRVEQAVGILSWLGPGALRLPHWLIEGWILAGLLLALVALVVGGRRERLILLAALAGCLALPIAAQASSANGTAWQGRYGLPLLVGVPMLAGWIIDRSHRLPRAAERTIGTAAPVVVAVAYVVAHQRLMTRSVVGLPNALFAGLFHGDWNGPASPVVLFAWAVAASLAYAGLVIGLVWVPSASASNSDPASVDDPEDALATRARPRALKGGGARRDAGSDTA